jgi:hypothetical protein
MVFTVNGLDAMASTKTPRGLASAGRRLWSDVVARYELEAHELLLLEQNCRTADLVAELQARIDDDGVVLASGKNHPALAEIRQQRIVLARLLVALRMPNDDDDVCAQRRGGLRGVQKIDNFGAASSA